MRKSTYIYISIITLMVFASCKKFLDVIPDDVATIDNAFATRIEAQKYLFTCYSYLPKNSDLGDDPAMCGGDEIWQQPTSVGYIYIARGFQRVVNPYGDRWGVLFKAIRDCNIFLENIGKVPDMEETERRRWRAEALFLKAYYNFYLVRMYGPIPLIKDNIAIDADENEVRVSREPLDSCFSYIVQLLDEANSNLPLSITNTQDELGRITQPIDLAFKAKVLVYAASPLFNGNTDQSSLKGKNGEPLFNQTQSQAKWDSAVIACKKAIDICEKAGFTLYHYSPTLQQYNLSDTILTQLSIRNSVCEKWNSEIIWANTQVNTVALQKMISTYWDPTTFNQTVTQGLLSPPLKIAEMFYSSHGVPITEDKSWNYGNRDKLQVAGTADQLYIRNGYTTAHLNFDREPRYYADLGFDGGVWYGQGIYDDKSPANLYYLEGLFKQRNGAAKANYGSVTGYYIKKLVYFQNVESATGAYSAPSYPFPILRLSDLYLLYSEALNEASGPSDEVYKYIDSVRARADLPTVKDAWSNYSNNPSKYTTKDGMRKIIHQERLIELAFEGQRFWDLRRWKESIAELNLPVQSWDLRQETTAAYYRPVTIYNQKFSVKDYFWPIDENTLELNPNLQQNLGW